MRRGAPKRQQKYIRTFGSEDDAELVERATQLADVAVDAERAGALELRLAVAAAQQADAQHARAPRREQVPDGVADDVALVGLDPEPPAAGEEEIGLRLGALHVASLDHNRLRRNAERV